MKVVCAGEAMIELSIDAPGRQIGFAGDAFNTAVYMARGLAPGSVNFATVLGQDALSDRMLAYFARQGLGTGRIRRHPDRLPGIYSIALDSAGERSFAYWREQSAARTLFEDGFASLEGADLVYFSGVTLAILPPEIRAALLAYLAAFPGKVRSTAITGRGCGKAPMSPVRRWRAPGVWPMSRCLRSTTRWRCSATWMPARFWRGCGATGSRSGR